MNHREKNKDCSWYRGGEDSGKSELEKDSMQTVTGEGILNSGYLPTSSIIY